MPNLKQIIEESEKLFKQQYRTAYQGVLADEVLKQGNSWFEGFLRSQIKQACEKMIEEVMVEKKYPDHGAVYPDEYSEGWDDYADDINNKIKNFFAEERN